MARPLIDLSGQVLDGRYKVLARIGKGGMGSVFRATDQKLARVVAVKVMNEQVPDEAASRRRFEREARAMATLDHPHCASVLDVGMHDGQPYVVMDFIAGQSLDTLVAEGPLPIARAVEITRQILFGLAHAHEHGIIHRDIKPANIVLSKKSGMGDHVMILDFGLAKIGEDSSNLSQGVIVGTPSYMSPEQIRGLVLDARADVYACGVLLYELLTGEKPFRPESGNEPLAICMMHLNVDPPRLADKLPGPDFGTLEDAVAHALAKDRDHRFGSAMAFANALANTSSRPTPRPPVLPEAQRLPVVEAPQRPPVVEPPRPPVVEPPRPPVVGASRLPAVASPVVEAPRPPVVEASRLRAVAEPPKPPSSPTTVLEPIASASTLPIDPFDDPDASASKTVPRAPAADGRSPSTMALDEGDLVSADASVRALDEGDLVSADASARAPDANAGAWSTATGARDTTQRASSPNDAYADNALRSSATRNDADNALRSSSGSNDARAGNPPRPSTPPNDARAGNAPRPSTPPNDARADDALRSSSRSNDARDDDALRSSSRSNDARADDALRSSSRSNDARADDVFVLRTSGTTEVVDARPLRNTAGSRPVSQPSDSRDQVDRAREPSETFDEPAPKRSSKGLVVGIAALAAIAVVVAIVVATRSAETPRDPVASRRDAPSLTGSSNDPARTARDGSARPDDPRPNNGSSAPGDSRPTDGTRPGEGSAADRTNDGSGAPGDSPDGARPGDPRPGDDSSGERPTDGSGTPEDPRSTDGVRPGDPRPSDGSATPDAPPPDPAVARVLAQADAHLARRWRDGAIDVLVKARRTFPKDARLPYRAGLLYLEKLWWPDGLKQLRAAIALDPKLRTDADLIRAAVRAFTSTMHYDWQLSGFLRKDIGAAARPHLEAAATTDKNPVVRNRAKAELAHIPVVTATEGSRPTAVRAWR